jgi:hypothetical protein
MVTSIIQSVQAFSITIGSGSTSNTQTITSVVKNNSAVFFTGFNTSNTSTDQNQFLTRAELTNATTVTAFRGTSSATTEVVTGYIVEFTSAAMASNAQHGTITIATSSTSGTATISSVGSDAVVFYLGLTGATTSISSANFWSTVALTNSTTVTATRNTAATFALTVGYVVVDFATANIQSIQARSVTLTSVNLSDTDTITSVTQGNAILVPGGINTGATSFATFGYRYQLTSATQVTLTRTGTGGSTRTINYTVLEFVSGILNSSVQRGSIALTSAASNTATISSIGTTYGLVNFTGAATNEATMEGIWYPSLVLTNNTTVTASINTSTATTVTVGYEAFEFTSSGTALTINWSCPGELAATQRVDPQSRMEWLATLLTDSLPRFELLVGQLADRNSPSEILFTQRSDPSIRIETTGNLRADSILPDETIALTTRDVSFLEELLTSQRADPLARQELLATLRNDGVLQEEWYSVLSTDRPVLVENTGSQQADSRLPFETSAGVRRDGVLPDETITSQGSDLPLPLESTGVLTITTDILIPIEWVATQVRDVTTLLELLGIIRADVSGPDEGLVRVANDRPVPAESLATQDRDLILPDETLGAVAVTSDTLLPLEGVGTLLVDRIGPDENGVTTQRTLPFPAELVSRQAGNTGIRDETYGTLAADTGSPADTLATLLNTLAGPAEVAATLAADYQALTDLLLAATGSAVRPLEILGAIRNDDTVRVEFIASVERDQPLPAEWIGTTNRVVGDTLLQVECLAEVTVTPGLPLEATNTPAPTPCSRILDPAVNNRILDPNSNNRVLEVEASSRTINARATIRILKPNPSSRTL